MKYQIELTDDQWDLVKATLKVMARHVAREDPAAPEVMELNEVILSIKDQLLAHDIVEAVRNAQ